MYQLLVYYPECEGARAIVSTVRGSEVLELIPQLLAEHERCEQIVVTLHGTKLFTVDCHGNRLS